MARIKKIVVWNTGQNFEHLSKVEIMGEQVLTDVLPYDFNFFIHPSFDDDNPGFVVSEEISGGAVAKHRDRRKCIFYARKMLEGKDASYIRECIEAVTIKRKEAMKRFPEFKTINLCKINTK